MSGNVLIFCPTYEELGRDMVRPDTLDSIKALKWDGKSTFVLSKVNPYSDGKLNILHQYQHARNLLLAGDYDALFTVEHDMIIPPDALMKLWAADAPVAYGVYLLRHGSYVLNAWRLEGTRYVGQTYTMLPKQLKKDLEHGEIRAVSGVGFGCTLIRRAVLERFEIHPAENNGHPVPDVPLAVDCVRAGIKQVAHFGVVCGHIEPGGNILWPGDEAGHMTKVLALQSVNAPVNEVVTRLVEGKEYDLPEYDAEELARAGYVLIKGDKPRAKSLAKPVKK